MGKLAFLEAAGASAKHSPRFRLPTLYVDNVFMTHQVTPPPSTIHNLPPLNVTSLSPSYLTGGLPTPRSPPSVSTPSTGKLIDPNLASKQLLPGVVVLICIHSHFTNVRGRTTRCVLD